MLNWSVVVPFFDEEKYLAATLASLAAQTERPLQLILVDNASRDASLAIAERFRETAADLEVEILREGRPGKASALARGAAAARGPLTAICDADTFYPPRYLETARGLFEDGGAGTVAVLAFGTSPPPGWANAATRLKGVVAAALMPRQTHSGGYGQAFRTEALKAAGGFSPDLWPYCLMDHEIMHRLVKRGRLKYAYRHWCAPSARRADRRRVRWTLGERLLYHATPYALKDWYFYRFLKSRFEARGVSELNLRRKDWEPRA